MSTFLRPWLRDWQTWGVYAQSVPHVGLTGRKDSDVWRFALKHDFVVVTTNARDFIPFLDVEVHPGLIVLRESGLTRQEQWDRRNRRSSMSWQQASPDF
ncbi:MAG: DUF5615 family PIN-like protein, partial [Terriglobales bacterium]